jgi:hypothetical protein
LFIGKILRYAQDDRSSYAQDDDSQNDTFVILSLAKDLISKYLKVRTLKTIANTH